MLGVEGAHGAHADETNGRLLVEGRIGGNVWRDEHGVRGAWGASQMKIGEQGQDVGNATELLLRARSALLIESGLLYTSPPVFEK